MIWGHSRRHMHVLLFMSHFQHVMCCALYSNVLCMVFGRFTAWCPGLFEKITIVLKGACATVMLLFILRSIFTKPIFTLQEHIVQKVTFGLLCCFHSIRNMQYRLQYVRHLSQLVIQSIEISVMLGWKLAMTRLIKQLLVAS